MPYGAELAGPLCVLYVEDDPALATLVRKALARRGHEMLHVVNADQALERIAEGGVDVIALDHTLAAETGLELLRRIGPRGNRPPIVYVTGSIDARLAVEALKTGADDYVIKDLSGEFYDLLIAALELAHERWRLKRARADNERAVRDARDRAEALLKEVNHRVANSLGLVASMVRLQASLVADATAQHALQETQNRIAAIAGVHRHLYTSDHVDRVEISDYLSNLTAELKSSMGDGADLVETRLAAGAIKTDKAVALGVIVTELVTNAIKYAYAEGASGPIRVFYEQPEDSLRRIVVEDDGVGWDGTGAPAGTGLGSKLLRAMARTLSAEVAYEPKPQGTRVVVTFPDD